MRRRSRRCAKQAPVVGDTMAVENNGGEGDVAGGPPTATISDGSESEGSETAGSDSDRGHRFSAEETIVIFDWDDTVLPSSWVQDQGLRLDGESIAMEWQQMELADLARLAGDTLQLAKQLGTVVLVTNAERGWIELSCQKFMPALYPYLESVKLLSARTEYERPDMSSPFEWKLNAFQSEIQRIFCADADRSSSARFASLNSHPPSAKIFFLLETAYMSARRSSMPRHSSRTVGRSR